MKRYKITLATLASLIMLETIFFAGRSNVEYGCWIWSGSYYEKTEQYNCSQLYIFQGLFEDDYFQDRGLSPWPGIDGKVIHIVYRMHDLTKPQIVLNQFHRDLLDWEKQGAMVAGLQLDFDSPTSRLEAYARYLSVIKSEIEYKYKLSITGLGTWLIDSKGVVLAKLAQSVDLIFFQLYRHDKPMENQREFEIDLINSDIPYGVGVLESQELYFKHGSLIEKPKINIFLR